MATRTRGRPVHADEAVLSDDVLFDAVLRAFGENGFDGTSVRDIARRLNVSHNLIPQRYGSKERLWFAAVDYGFEKFDTAIVQEGEALGDDELLILRGVIASTIEMVANNPSLLQIINQEASHPGPRLTYLFEKFIQPSNLFFENWLNKLIAEGRIAPTSGRILYFLINHGAGGLFALPSLNGLFAATTDGPEPSVREQAEMAVSILFDGILPR